MHAADIAIAEKHLSAADPLMARLIERHGPCTLGINKRDPFHVLCMSIISQQLSGKAADTIAGRVKLKAGTKTNLKPAHFLKLSQEELRACGLSNAKAKALKALAQAVDSGAFSFAKLRKLDHDAAVKALDDLPGVGPWTAEMFVMFALNHPDMFSLGDAGLRRGVNQLYGKGRALSDKRTLAIAQIWSPYRTIACWYLWAHADDKQPA